jgi:hypothetical protein
LWCDAFSGWPWRQGDRCCDSCCSTPIWRQVPSVDAHLQHSFLLVSLDIHDGEGRSSREMLLLARSRHQQGFVKLAMRTLWNDHEDCRRYPWPKGHSAPRERLLWGSFSSSRLMWRIFDLTAASHADGAPSGLVPDVVDDGRGLRSH